MSRNFQIFSAVFIIFVCKETSNSLIQHSKELNVRTEVLRLRFLFAKHLPLEFKRPVNSNVLIEFLHASHKQNNEFLEIPSSSTTRPLSCGNPSPRLRPVSFASTGGAKYHVDNWKINISPRLRRPEYFTRTDRK